MALSKKTSKINAPEQTTVSLPHDPFYNNLQKIFALIRSAGGLDEMMAFSRQIGTFLGAEEALLFAVAENNCEIYSRIRFKGQRREIRLPMNINSVAGYVALHKKILRLRDAYDPSELNSLKPRPNFDSELDLQAENYARKVLAVPIVDGENLVGVLQCLNKKDREEFSMRDEQMAIRIADTIARTIYHYVRQGHQGRTTSKYALLIEENLLSTTDLEKAIDLAREKKQSIEQTLITDFHVNKTDIGRSLHAFYCVPFFQFTPEIPIPIEFLNDLDPNYLCNQLWVPIKQQGTIVDIAINDPRALDKIDDLKKQITSTQYRFHVGLAEDIIATVKYFWGIEENKPKVYTEQNLTQIIDTLPQDFFKQKEEEEKFAQPDHGIIRLVNQIITNAYTQGVSDIHIELCRGPTGESQIRFRIDGICRQYRLLPKSVHRAIISRIKIMADMDISNRRMPQDGKIKFAKFGGPDIRLRVATLPTINNDEEAVLRILASNKPMPIDELAMSSENLQRFQEIIQTPYGIVLVVGPTGSGKTTTLHSALGFINTPEKKIWTAEDPVEITQQGLSQIQVNTKAGYTFAMAMRSLLRADPDVIMIGEIRDRETAAIAIEASLTGHLVFSTLHTNSAPETIVRLLDLGMDPFNFADALIGILAQRLARKLCTKCREPLQVSDEILAKIENEYSEEGIEKIFSGDNHILLYKSKGCQSCYQGYQGRIAVHELLIASSQIKIMIQRRESVTNLRKTAISEGMLTLKQDGIRKVISGYTDLKQVRAVCK